MILEHFGNIQALWDEYDVYRLRARPKCILCIDEVDEAYLADLEGEKIHEFLLGLNSDYSSLACTVLSSDPLPSLDRVFEMLTQEEDRLQLLRSTEACTETMAFTISPASLVHPL